jgi:MinD superfamily P-loop ATPase
MTHAQLGIAQENSGKLVALVRREGKALTELSRRKILFCDGSPGIGCPVMASIAGARMVLVVTEPTLSGLHDLQRVAQLCQQFQIKTGVCINKADLNPELAEKIEQAAAAFDLAVWGRIRYDDAVTMAQIGRKSVVEIAEEGAATDICSLWERVQKEMQQLP